MTTPLGNITGPPASIAFNANSANNERLLPNSALSRSTKSQNISAPALAGNVSSSSANSTNFRASVYLAATAREAHAAKSQSTDNNNGFTPLSATTPTMAQPSVPAGTSSNGEAAVYKVGLLNFNI
ncbi:unnamed protein product [Anisakis simplex]|uniref:Uncharacterized protein n=1 Tax=Anisakis simplex TaxID=6269 RepID=A0A3P6P136_ANISI|nr:unnamed protein product [Anisakis simplex]